MMPGSIVLYLNPWKLRRERARQRLEALRRRDGDHCRRCRRPLRFDLPSGHDQAPTVQPILPGANGAGTGVDNLCLCHGRCIPETRDQTVEVQERVRAREEEAAKRRRTRKRAA